MKIITIIIAILLIPLVSANNLTEKDISIEIILPEQIVLNQTYTNLFKLTNNNHTSGITDEIHITVNYYITNTSINNIFTIIINSYKSSGTGQFTLTQPGKFQLCGFITNSSHLDLNQNNNLVCKNFTITDPDLIYCNISINITTNKLIYNNQETIKFYNTLNNNSFPFTIEYWIEDLFHNIIKSKTNTTNLNQKSYTPNIEEQDKTLIIKNRLYLPACINSGKTTSKKLITIKNNITKPENSTITINKVSDNAEFGDTINVELSIYKGNTAKQVIYLWLEKDKIISEKSKVKVLDKYTEYSFSVPIQIKPDCDNDFETDFYNLIVEGLNQTTTQEIKVKKTLTNLCQIEYIETETPEELTNQIFQPPISKFTYTIHSLPEIFYINKSFNITINFTNTETKKHNISVHSYIYQNSKCLSLTRIYNNYSFQLLPSQSKLITLEITNNNTQNQSYKLKVKIKKNNLKTYKEITTTLPIFTYWKNQQPSINNQPPILKITNQNNSLFSQPNNNSINLLPTGMAILNNPNTTVFESSKQETKSYLPYILFIILIISSIMFITIKKPLFSRR